MANDRNGLTIATGTDYLVVGTARNVSTNETLLLAGDDGQHAIRCLNSDIGTIGSVYVHVNSSAPSDLFAGRLWLDTSVSTLKVYNGSAWVTADAAIADGSVTEAKLANTHVLRADRQAGNPYANLSTTTITQWYSFTVPANKLASRNVRVLAHGTLKQNSGSSQNFRAVVRLGGTDIHEASGSVSDDADDAIWRMELELSYRANRAQFISGTWRVSGQYNSSDGISNIFGITKDGVWGNDAVTQNDTGDLALTFHQKWDTSTTNSDFKVYSVTVEYV